MKLNINKAYDLSSISVLPPHNRRLSGINTRVDACGLGRNQASQLRSQSQQSLSQGTSLSQISQSSLAENLTNDQKFDSQERDKLSKRISSLPPVMAARDDSQQLSSTSNNVMRWSCATPDNRCRVSEELERRLRLLESSLNKMCMILDSLQSDVMQVNRAVKEVSLEMEGIRQKTNLLDNSTHQLLKEEEDIKALLQRSMKFITDEMMKKDDFNRLKETPAAIPPLSKEIEAQLLGFRREICVVISKNMEVLANNMKSIINNLPAAILSREGKSCITTQRHQSNQISNIESRPANSSFGQIRRNAMFNMGESPKFLKSKVTNSNKYAVVKHEEIPLVQQELILIESDEESGGSLCCILLNKETSAHRKEHQLDKEAKEETVRILRQARMRKRRRSTCINIT